MNVLPDDLDEEFDDDNSMDSDDSDESEASEATEVGGINKRSASNANIINK